MYKVELYKLLVFAHFLTNNLISFQWKYVWIVELKIIYISIIQHYNLRPVTLQSDHSPEGHICHHTVDPLNALQPSSRPLPLC